MRQPTMAAKKAPANTDNKGERRVQLHDNQGANVGADGHKAGVTQRKLSGKPGDQVQANRHDDIDTHQKYDVLII